MTIAASIATGHCDWIKCSRTIYWSREPSAMLSVLGKGLYDMDIPETMTFAVLSRLCREPIMVFTAHVETRCLQWTHGRDAQGTNFLPTKECSHRLLHSCLLDRACIISPSRMISCLRTASFLPASWMDDSHLLACITYNFAWFRV